MYVIIGVIAGFMVGTVLGLLLRIRPVQGQFLKSPLTLGIIGALLGASAAGAWVKLAVGETVEHVETPEQFEKAVFDSDKPVLVDFHADWCPPCRQLAPILDEIAADYRGRAKVVKVNVDRGREVARRFGVRGIPMVLIFDDGKQMYKWVGLYPPQAYRGALDVAIAN